MVSPRSPALTEFINSSEFRAIHNISDPIISCMGTIHDFRRPILRKKMESTIGDQTSLSE
jgi:hypothetical protein